MIPPLDLKAPSLCRLVLLAATGPLIQAQVIQAPQNAQVTPSITKFTDINVGSVVARPFSGALVRLNSSLGTNSARGGISLGRFTLSGKKGDVSSWKRDFSSWKAKVSGWKFKVSG